MFNTLSLIACLSPFIYAAFVVWAVRRNEVFKNGVNP